MGGYSCAEVISLACAALTRQRVACASESDNIMLHSPVSPHPLKFKCSTSPC